MRTAHNQLEDQVVANHSEAIAELRRQEADADKRFAEAEAARAQLQGAINNNSDEIARVGADRSAVSKIQNFGM